MKPHLALLSAVITCFALSGTSAADGRSLTEFDAQETKDLGWRVVDDGVMGGLSKGKMEIKDPGVLHFNGTLSLENNGGFSSLRTDTLDLDLSEAKGIVARVKGDGRSYQLRLGTDARYRGMEVSFSSEFRTKKDRWVEVKIPFKKLQASFRGMKLNDKEFDPAKVRRLGLLLGDKKTGPFSLKVDWIRTYGDKKAATDVVSLAVADGRFNTLAAALKAGDLVETLQGKGPFTIFAPTDEAFAKLPKGTVEDLLKPENLDKLKAILTYHAIPGRVDLPDALKAGKAKTVNGAPLSIGFNGGRVFVNGAALINADVKASNGIIHVIDSVLLPPAPKNDLASVAERAGTFKTLLAAVKAAGLNEALTGEESLTIFAPTDEAFAKLPKGTIGKLLKKENRDQLRAILALHAVQGKVSAGDALNAKTATATNGGELQFSIKDGLFKVNGATILTTDITCDNGVIHVIDKVLLPRPEKAQSKSQSAEHMPAKQRIEMAIDKGVPIFNRGDHEKCAAIYKDVLSELAVDQSIDQRARSAVAALIEKAERVEATEKAWMLRHGLDALHKALPQ